jgi:hypothetical protein
VKDDHLLAGVKAGLRPLPPSLVYRAAGGLIRRHYDRRLRETGLPVLAAPELERVWPELPAPLREAIDRRGGRDEVGATLVRVARETPAAVLAVLAAHPRWRRRALRGAAWDRLVELSATGPTILVVPYLGAHLQIALALLDAGTNVATFVGTDAERLLGGLPEAAGAGRAGLELIPVPSTSAAIRADRALRRGSTVIWRPDTIPAWEGDLLSSLAGRPGSWDTLAGWEVPASRLVQRLVERRGIRPVVASAAFDVGHLPRADLRLTTLDDDESEAWVHRMYEALSDHIFDDIDQWTILLRPELLIGFQQGVQVHRLSQF